MTIGTSFDVRQPSAARLACQRLGNRDLLADEAEEYVVAVTANLVGDGGGDVGELLAIEQQ